MLNIFEDIFLLQTLTATENVLWEGGTFVPLFLSITYQRFQGTETWQQLVFSW